MDRTESRKNFTFSMVILAVAGVTMLLLQSIANGDPDYKKIMLTKAIWKFEPINLSKVDASRKIFALWKLVLAGVMIACIIQTTLVRFHDFYMSLLLSLLALLLWISFLVYYWFSFVSTPSSSDAKQEKAGETLFDEGTQTWAKRFKSSKLLSASEDRRLPVTVVTGFLGSGKTTLIKKILHNTVGLRVLVIENEIGQEGVDHELLMQQIGKEDIILMNNGCICCTVRQDLLSTFRKMFANEAFAQLDWIIIETTGLADPAPLIQSFYMDADCQQRLRLDGVLTVVDCKHFPEHLKKKEGIGAHGGVSEALRQVAYADRVLLSKADLVRQPEITSLCSSINEINSTASVMLSSHGDVDIKEVLNIRCFSPEKAVALLKEMAVSASYPSLFIRRDESGKVLRKNIRHQIKAALGATGKASKGVVSTFSLVAEDPLDLDKFNLWLTDLLRTKGPQIYRVKGVLHMKGYDEDDFIVHCVHMICDGEKRPKTAHDSKRKSKLVFIGDNLDRQDIEAGFASTLT